MIDAVNSTIAGVATSRDVAQVSSGANVAPPVPSEAPRAPQAPYVSPYISVDLNFDRAVLQIRDSETGDVEQQFPTQSRLAQLSRAQAEQESSDIRQTLSQQQSNINAESATSQQGLDVITIQDVTSNQASNTTTFSSPQVAVAALSTGAQSGQVNETVGLSVLA